MRRRALPASAARALVAIAGSLALALGGCARPEASRPLTIAITREPISLNPILEGGSIGNMLGSTCFSYLLKIDDRERLVPDAAREVPSLANGGISPDGLTVTYRLRPHMRWSDGAPFDARDVAFSFRAVMNPDNLVPAGRAGYDRIASVRAPDPLTVRVRLARPFSALLTYFFASDTNYALLPAHLLAKAPNVNRVPFDAAPICTGPYRIVEWRRGDRLRFQRNENYFGPKPSIERFDVRFVPQPQTIVDQVRSGEADAYLQADASVAPQLRALANERIVKAPVGIFATEEFNVSAAPTNEAAVRRAIVLGSDWDRIVPGITLHEFTHARATRGWFGWAYDARTPEPRYDPAAAAELLDSAGWRRASAGGMRARGGVNLAVTILVRSDVPAANAAAVYEQQALHDLGIAASIHRFSPQQFVDVAGPVKQGRFSIVIEELLANADPDPTLWIGCDQFAPQGENLTRYCDRELDRIDAAGLATFDRAARTAIYARAQRILQRDLPMPILWENDEIDAVPASLSGFTTSFQSPFWNVAAWKFDR